MLSKICTILMDVYGYEASDVITHRIREEYDVMLASGPVIILLKDNKPSKMVEMSIIDNAQTVTANIGYDRSDYDNYILASLTEFSLNRLAPLTVV